MSGIAPGSSQAVLLEVMGSVLDTSWAPEPAARWLLDQEHDPRAVRKARTRLLIASQDRMTMTQARALATLNMAINLAVEDARVQRSVAPDTAEGGGRRGT